MGENAPENAKMMVYKKRLIDHHSCCNVIEGKLLNRHGYDYNVCSLFY